MNLTAAPKNKRLLLSPPILLFFFTLHSLLINGYIFGWWHNVGMQGFYLSAVLARLDPTLYLRDLSVTAQKQGIINSSYFWEIFAWLMNYFRMEDLCFFLYTIFLYLTQLTLYYLSYALFGNRIVSYLSVLLYSRGLRLWIMVGAPIIYTNFLHPYIIAMPLCLLSLILFLRKRYALSLLLCGILLNIHAMYAFFLLVLYFVHFSIHFREITPRLAMKLVLILIIPALPSLFFIIPQLKISYGSEVWLEAVRWTHWFHDFPTTWKGFVYRNFLLFILLFIIAFYQSPPIKKKKIVLSFILTIVFICLFSTIFTECAPTPFIVKLQLWRSTWIIALFSLPFISYYLYYHWNTSLWNRFAIIGTLITLTAYPTITSAQLPDFQRFPYWVLPLFILMILSSTLMSNHPKWKPWVYLTSVFLLLVILICSLFPNFYTSLFKMKHSYLVIFLFLYLFLLFLKELEAGLSGRWSKGSIYLIAFLLFMGTYDGAVLLKGKGPHIDYGCFRPKVNHPWIDMQLYCKENTPKDALIMVPPYMQGFKFFSQRSTFGDWLDGMFANWYSDDYAQEWLKRMRALGWEGVRGEWSSYNHLSTSDFISIAKEYKVDYIVTERYVKLDLPIVYANQKFILYTTKLPS